MKEVTREWLIESIKDSLREWVEWEEQPARIRINRDYDIRFEENFGDDDDDRWIDLEFVEITADDRFGDWVCDTCILEPEQVDNPEEDESFVRFIDNIIKTINRI